MKSIIAILTFTCAVSAAGIPSLLERGTLSALAVCNAKKGESCPGSGQRGCQNNGGHSMLCVETSRGKYNWIEADNCPDSGSHCDCATGLCVRN